MRDLIERPEPLVLAGVYDALTAAMAERAGFTCGYLTGAGVANTQLAMPDVGIATFDMIAAQAFRAINATTVPLVVDVDAGFGGPSSVMYVVHALGSIGVSAIQMEDQQMPKRCGHFDRKAVVPVAEMQAKVDAAIRARPDDNFLVIARTDAVAVEGFDAAIRRARAYQDAGADIIFVEAPTDLEQIERIPQEITSVPLVMNVVQGGRTPELSVSALADLGYKIVLHANLLMRTMMWAGAEALTTLRKSGSADSGTTRFVEWGERQGLMRLPDFDRIEDELGSRWSQDDTLKPTGS